MKTLKHSLVAALAAVGMMAASAQAQRVQGVTNTEVVVGMNTDLSGPAGSYGVAFRNAVQMRFDAVNEAGGVHGRKLRLVVEDHQYQVPRAVQAGNKLLRRDRVFMMAGNLGTPHNLAIFEEQFALKVPNLFPLTAARQMHEPFNPLKFVFQPSYYAQIRAGVKHLVQTQNKRNVCVLYQDTEFGQEIFEGVRDQLAAMNMRITETATNKPTDTDFSSQITKLRAANCDLIASGGIVRDIITPMATARRMGWNVDFVGQMANYDQIVASAPGNVTEGLYIAHAFVLPYRDKASPEQLRWMDQYRGRFNNDPTIGAVYGEVTADMIIFALDRAGRNLTSDSFVKGMEAIQNYKPIFDSGIISFGPQKRQGGDTLFLSQVRGGRFTVVQSNLAH